jgi:D-isomer specific 2-hydroxyacid dehydrogenase, catalytic domain
LNAETASLAAGFEAVCVFVNDQLDAEVIAALAKSMTRLIALRCAGYNNVDLTVARERGIMVVRVPAYSPYAVAEQAFFTRDALEKIAATTIKNISDFEQGVGQEMKSAMAWHELKTRDVHAPHHPRQICVLIRPVPSSSFSLSSPIAEGPLEKCVVFPARCAAVFAGFARFLTERSTKYEKACHSTRTHLAARIRAHGLRA